ncbi:MAG: hypothetical protein GEU26_01725 [Nitrososphaeraceae archaeon]|nr:hypothetical protein [Nitrososphaeraceae archaeon]
MSKSRDIVHAYQTRKDGTVVLVIPKPLRDELEIKSGDEFLVKKDGNNRIVYRRIFGTR